MNVRNVALFISLFIPPYTHSCFPLVGCTLIRIREDFCQEIFLKQHLKTCPSDQAKSLNSSPSTLMRSQRFGPFSPMKCWCLLGSLVCILQVTNCSFKTKDYICFSTRYMKSWVHPLNQSTLIKWMLLGRKSALSLHSFQWPTGGDSTGCKNKWDCM